MDFNQIIGIFALLVGVVDLLGYALLMTGREVKWFGKLEPMRKRFGQSGGTAIHFTAYVIVPLVAGTIFLLQGG